LRALVDGRYPYYVYAKVFEVVEFLGDAGDIPPAVAVCVEERCWIDLPAMSDENAFHMTKVYTW
jgi:hypothetical protein